MAAPQRNTPLCILSSNRSSRSGRSLRDPNDTGSGGTHTLPYQRYTYWVEDLSGYLDAGVAGNLLAAGKHQRASGTNPNEIALFTVFQPDQVTDAGDLSAKALVDNRPTLFTVPTMKQFRPGCWLCCESETARSSLWNGCWRPTESYPRGATATLTKEHLKPIWPHWSQAKDVNSISTAITTTLPSFASRAGGNTFSYTKNLAANIIDYTTPAQRPHHRLRSHNRIGHHTAASARSLSWSSAFDRNNWVATGTAPPYPVTIQVSTYVQLWNPHNIPVTGSLTVRYNNVDTITVNGTNYNYTPPPDYVDPAFTLQPNSYKVILIPKPPSGPYVPQSHTINWGPSAPQRDQYSLPRIEQ